MKPEDCKEGMRVYWKYGKEAGFGIITQKDGDIWYKYADSPAVYVFYENNATILPHDISYLNVVDSEFEIKLINRKYSVPYDYHDPDWSNISKVQDWKNYIIEELQNCWDSFSTKQKVLIATNAQKIADNEDWD